MPRDAAPLRLGESEKRASTGSGGATQLSTFSVHNRVDQRARRIGFGHLARSPVAVRTARRVMSPVRVRRRPDE
jgi:hypothetical protein